MRGKINSDLAKRMGGDIQQVATDKKLMTKALGPQSQAGNVK